MGKNPYLAPARAGELVKYVLVELDVESKYHDDFKSKMTELTSLFFDYKKWELVYAAYPITGVVNRFIHIWRVPDEDTIVEIMLQGAETEDVQAAPETDALAKEVAAAFRECYRDVQHMISRTTHTVMTSLPYDPMNVGLQTQTVLVDAKKNIFVIDHADLRDPGKRPQGLVETDLDISDRLERVRRGLRKRHCYVETTTNAGAPNASAPQSTSGAPDDQLRDQRIQELLNRGVATARLKDQTLLFNLAGLKPKSVFEAIEQETPEAKASRLTKGPRFTFPKDVSKLLLATPWGGVYQLDQSAMDLFAVPVSAAKLPGTALVVAPLIEGKVPLATIPDERTEIIGNGCACFVINLASFNP